MNTLNFARGTAWFCIHLSLPWWSRQSQKHRSLQSTPCCPNTGEALQLLRALWSSQPMGAPWMQWPRGQTVWGDCEPPWASVNRNHGVTFTMSELCQVVFSSRLLIWLYERNSLLGSLPMQYSNDRCQLSPGNRTSTYSLLPGYKDKKYSTITCCYSTFQGTFLS